MTGEPARPTSVRLKYRGADVFLSEGSYVIGRSAICQLVVDDVRASRRHARIVVEKNGVTLEDLGSVNGVFVNGHRIARGPHPLADGDRIGIGTTELELALGGPPSRRPDRPTLGTPLPAMQTATPSRSDRPIRALDSEPPTSDPPLSSAGTQRADAFELVGPIAGKALASGRAAEAENILNAHLSKTLEDARKNRPVAQSTLNAAVSYALELARALGTGRWLNYVLELLELLRVVPDGALSTKLLNAIARVDAVDTKRVNSYVNMLRALPESFEKVRALHQMDELTKAALRKRQP